MQLRESAEGNAGPLPAEDTPEGADGGLFAPFVRSLAGICEPLAQV